MKLKVKSEDPKKPTPKEIEAANKFAKEFALRKKLLIGEEANVGNSVPKFVDSVTGREVTTPQNNLPSRTIMDINQVPLYVKNLEMDKQLNIPYYVDEKTGELQYVHPDIARSSRFNPNRGLYGATRPQLTNSLVVR